MCKTERNRACNRPTSKKQFGKLAITNHNVSNWKLISSQVRHDERSLCEAWVAEELEDGLQDPSFGKVPQLDHQPRDQHSFVAQPRQHQDHVEVEGGQVEEELGEVRGAAAVCRGTPVS